MSLLIKTSKAQQNPNNEISSNNVKVSKGSFQKKQAEKLRSREMKEG